MVLVLRRHLMTILIFLISLTSASCSTRTEDGGQHTGGGAILSSDAKLVNATLDSAIRLASEEDSHRNIFVQFWKARGQSDKREYIKIPTRIFPTFISSTDENNKFDSPVLRAMLK